MKAYPNITAPDERMRPLVQEKIDGLNKPKGSLGRLEELAMQICLIQQTTEPALNHPCHILFGADHGIEREGVSVSPREVTWQQMINFTKGGGGVNMFCRQHGFRLVLADMGVDHDLSAWPDIRNRKTAAGTRNFLYEAAMSRNEMEHCMQAGAALVDEQHGQGCNVICFGEMGIGNTSPSSVWMHLFGNIPLPECIGAGAGLDNDGISRKKNILNRAIENFHACHTDADTEEIIRWFGGFEMVAAIGGMLRAAEHRMIILVDGFIMSACMLAASRLCPEVLPYAVFGHAGDETGHRRLLETMNARPLLHLNLRLGEGTGALCAYPLLQSAVNMVCEMNSFTGSGITRYF
ncbi:MAG: nicotinate-nucleotide--dimethylbenzimidazole phosphoribosyltransferase [Paraprevotella sp.]|nr:nicotinate-nucleotide--dimethylbenzimidazole phosphoribosyltransferase [Paraprevotella sp.]